MFASTLGRSVMRTAALRPMGARSMSGGIQGFLDESHARLPTKNVARFSEQSLRMSLLKLKTYSEALKNGMSNSGMRPNDKLIVMLPHTGEHSTVQIACALGQFEMLSFTEMPSEDTLRQVMIDTGAKGIFFDPRFCKEDAQTVVEDIVVIDDMEMIVTPDVPELKFVFTTGFDVNTCYQRFKDLLYFHYMGVTKDLRATNKLGSGEDFKWMTTYNAKGQVTGEYTQLQIVERAQKVITDLSLTADSSFYLSTKTVSPQSLLVATMASVLSCAQLIAVSKHPNGKLNQAILDLENPTGSFGDVPVEGLKHASF